MKMKKRLMIKLVPLAVAGIGLLSSCQKDTDLYEGNSTVKDYNKNWVERFGNVDPTQDWNGATRGSVTVTTDNATTVKVYALVGDNYSIVGEYDEVNGTQTLSFDIPKGVTDIKVNTINKSAEVKVGESIDFTNLGITRAIHTYDNNGIKVENSESSYEFTAQQLNDVRSVLPENVDNRDKVTKNFYFTSKGETLTIYPFYWQTGNILTLGIYYYDNSGKMVRIPIYTTKDTNANDARLFYQGSDGDYVVANTTSAYKWAAIPSDYSGTILSKGINVTLPAGLKYGMYIYNHGEKDQTYLYSQASDNNDKYYVLKDGVYVASDDKDNACYGSIYEYDGKTYLGFEDWKGANAPGGFDLNDLIVMISPKPNFCDIEKEETGVTYTVACEDLGDTDDFDFNDIVFSVNHISGKDKATFTPLAAGGTIKATVYFKDSQLGEIHALLGTSANSDGSYPMINTSSKTAYAKAMQLGVDKDFSMAEDMGGFSIKVGDDESNAVTIQAPPVGSCPQMFVVPSNWAWPKERVHISDAYSKFAGWSESAKTNVDWYNTYNEDKVLK